jgi:uncharacterized membrane protein YjgN (DUF898 family)
MDQLEQKNYFEFTPSIAKYYGMTMLNFLLCFVTLGFYYPWAKEKNLKFIYSNVSFQESPFAFHGTGQEMFKGFIKAIVFLGILGVLFAGSQFFIVDYPAIGIVMIILAYIGYLILIPLAIHGSMKYRLSRSSYRGIRFGYRGSLKELMKVLYLGIFLTVITCGIYAPFFTVNIRKYIMSNTKYGDASFDFDGEGGDYFKIYILGNILTVLTCGIYSFWWMKDMTEFMINNTSLNHKGNRSEFTIHAEVIEYFINTIRSAALVIVVYAIIFGTMGSLGMMEGNNPEAFGMNEVMILSSAMILAFCVLGLGLPYVYIANLKMLIVNTTLDGSVDLHDIKQTEDKFTDATGDDLADFMDIDTDLAL